MSQKLAVTSRTLLNYISIKPKILIIKDPPNSLKHFVPPSTSDIVDNYENFSSYDISLYYVDKKLNDKEKIGILQSEWVPDNNFNFLYQQIGNQN